ASGWIAAASLYAKWTRDANPIEPPPSPNQPWHLLDRKRAERPRLSEQTNRRLPWPIGPAAVSVAYLSHTDGHPGNPRRGERGKAQCMGASLVGADKIPHGRRPKGGGAQAQGHRVRGQFLTRAVSLHARA